MENDPSLDDIHIWRVKDICCAALQKKLRKDLSRIHGVYAVAKNPDKGLVSVRGRVNANAVLQTITKTGKTAEIIYYPTNNSSSDSSDYYSSRHAEERPRNDDYKQHKNHRSSDEARYQQDTHQVPQKANCKHQMNDCNRPDESMYNRNRYQGPQNENYQQHRRYSFEENHVCEAYIPPTDQRLDRHYEGRMQHNMSRPMFRGQVPLGYIPYHAGLHNRPLFRPPVGPPVYAHGSGRPVGGFRDYDFYCPGFGRGYNRMM